MEKQINLRVSPELHKLIKQLAEAKNRSMNMLIVTVLEDYVLEHRKVKGFSQRLQEREMAK